MGRGRRVQFRTCPYCKQSYTLTNWMRRKTGMKDKDGRLLDNTHLQACYDKYKGEQR